MAYRYAEHGGELEVEIDATSEAEVFVAAFEMLAELVSSGERGEAVQREIELVEADRALLLVDWLNELVFLADTQQFVPAELMSLELEGERLHASVSGERAHPRQLLKAATLNSLELDHGGGCWHARVVLDV